LIQHRPNSNGYVEIWVLTKLLLFKGRCRERFRCAFV